MRISRGEEPTISDVDLLSQLSQLALAINNLNVNVERDITTTREFSALCLSIGREKGFVSIYSLRRDHYARKKHGIKTFEVPKQKGRKLSMSRVSPKRGSE